MIFDLIKGNKIEGKESVKNDWLKQGTLTEGEGSVQLNSLLRQVVL